MPPWRRPLLGGGCGNMAAAAMNARIKTDVWAHPGDAGPHLAPPHRRAAARSAPRADPDQRLRGPSAWQARHGNLGRLMLRNRAARQPPLGGTQFKHVSRQQKFHPPQLTLSVHTLPSPPCGGAGPDPPACCPPQSCKMKGRQGRQGGMGQGPMGRCCRRCCGSRASAGCAGGSCTDLSSSAKQPACPRPHWTSTADPAPRVRPSSAPAPATLRPGSQARPNRPQGHPSGAASGALPAGAAPCAAGWGCRSLVAQPHCCKLHGESSQPAA